MSKKNETSNSLEKAFGITWAFSNPKQAFLFAKSEIEKKIKTSKLNDRNIPVYFDYLNALNVNKPNIRGIV